MSSQVESEINDLIQSLGTSTSLGISECEARRRLRKYGRNEPIKAIYRYSQATNVCVAFLTAAVVFAFHREILLASISGIIAGIFLTQRTLLRRRITKILATPGRHIPSESTVIRDGKLLNIQPANIVPGDIVRLQCGDIVPADGRLMEAVNLEIDESVLSKEHAHIVKDALFCADSSNPTDCPRNAVFLGTVVTRGRGTFAVTETGSKTRACVTGIYE